VCFCSIVAHRALRDEFNSAGRVILIKTPDARFNAAVFVYTLVLLKFSMIEREAFNFAISISKIDGNLS